MLYFTAVQSQTAQSNADIDTLYPQMSNILYFEVSGDRGTLNHFYYHCYGPSMAKMSGDVLAMKKTCSNGNGCRCRTYGPPRKLTRDILTNLRRSINDASLNIRRCIGEDSRYIRSTSTVNDVLLESASVCDPSACDRQISAMRRRRNGDVFTTYRALLRAGMG